MINEKNHRWIRKYHRSNDNAPWLLCFPHAGGNANYFFSLSKSLAPDISVFSLQYPGRQDRLAEPLINNLMDYVTEIANQLIATNGRPLSFMGHSMGAVIAYEVAHNLEQSGDYVNNLFLSSHAPFYRQKKEKLHKYSDSKLLTSLISLGGLSTELLEDDGFNKMLLPIMRSDLMAVENFLPEADTQMQYACIYALCGNQDERVSLAEMNHWKYKTAGGFSLHEFIGGHFYMENNITKLSDLIRLALI